MLRRKRIRYSGSFAYRSAPYLTGKGPHWNAVPLDGPPSFRRPGLDRHHHLLGFVGIVVRHFTTRSPYSARRLPIAVTASRPSAINLCPKICVATNSLDWCWDRERGHGGTKMNRPGFAGGSNS